MSEDDLLDKAHARAQADQEKTPKQAMDDAKASWILQLVASGNIQAIKSDPSLIGMYERMGRPGSPTR